MSRVNCNACMKVSLEIVPTLGIIPKILKQVDGKQFTHGILVPGEKVVSPTDAQDLVWLEIIGLQFVQKVGGPCSNPSE